MIEAIRRVLQIPELKEKIIFTLSLLFVCRIGSYIPVPGGNADLVVSLFKFATGGGQNLFQLADIFSGGAFAKMTILALGVMPYISASIIMQLMVTLIPSLQRDIRESPDQGRRKIAKWTRIATLVLAFFQSGLYAMHVLKMNMTSPGIIVPEIADVTAFGVSWLFYFTVMITMTAGTLFLMWVGEQITEKGIGNGISLIIATGILASLPSTIGTIVKQLNLG